jgi:Tol biopolymer transport system component
MRLSFLTAVTGLFVCNLLCFAQEPSQSRKADPATTVARMARVGSATSPSFSPDGRWISFISNMSGMPQVWVVPAEGGYPRMVTNGDDPVAQAEWSPASDWLAVTIAPGGGLNTQVYVVKPDGSGMKLLTKGGQDNNGFDAWSEDGKQIAIDSSRDNPAARDSFLIDVASGQVKLAARNPGIGNISNLSRDGKRALLSRLKNRGDNNLYLLDIASSKDTLITKHEGVHCRQ